ncbi:helix-turn-helix transcriptional regulator [Vibrio parahaemolyticus]|uniref:helix-turn-helix transcriptional regulator n=1 Tax=Vibrio parahaemolyticus TaxID=670 RepID=UPI0032979231|nr:helix-turn-helix transcriptional regulator [Vibrio parahaemolyticus]MDG2783263.1 helix-turn-helix transcriptional regulator [Vibrio parahaemolyticus]
MSDTSVVAARIKEVRIRLGLTQAVLGEMLGLDKSRASSRINHYEKGRHFPPYEFMMSLSRLTHTPLSCFYEPDPKLAQTIKDLSELSKANRELITHIIDELKSRDKSK